MLDAAGVAEGLEAALPIGVRSRQLSARTLLVGMLVALAEGRPAQLARAHAALSTASLRISTQAFQRSLCR